MNSCFNALLAPSDLVPQPFECFAPGIRAIAGTNATRIQTESMDDRFGSAPQDCNLMAQRDRFQQNRRRMWRSGSQRIL
jgi:hypothetical protein